MKGWFKVPHGIFPLLNGLKPNEVRCLLAVLSLMSVQRSQAFLRASRSEILEHAGIGRSPGYAALKGLQDAGILDASGEVWSLSLDPETRDDPEIGDPGSQENRSRNSGQKIPKVRIQDPETRDLSFLKTEEEEEGRHEDGAGARDPSSDGSRDPRLDRLEEHYRAEWAKVGYAPRPEGASGRREAFRKGLKAHGFETALKLITGHSRSSFHQGENDRGKRYADPRLAFKPSNLEDFMDLATDAPVAESDPVDDDEDLAAERAMQNWRAARALEEIDVAQDPFA